MRTQNYPQIPSQSAGRVAKFAEQMADFARGQLLVELRERRHLSQEAAAHEIGTSSKTLRAWEHGGKIRWDNAKRVAQFYGVDPERLVSRDLPADAPPLTGSSDDRFERLERKLDQALSELSDLRGQLPPADPAVSPDEEDELLREQQAAETSEEAAPKRRARR